MSDAVDVYAEWIDAIDNQEKKRKEAGETGAAISEGQSEPESEREETQDELTEDDLVDYREFHARKQQKKAAKVVRRRASDNEDEESEDSDYQSGKDDVESEAEETAEETAQESDDESEASFTDSDI